MNRRLAPALAVTFAGALALTACGGTTAAPEPAPATITHTATPEAVETTATPAACITALDISNDIRDITTQFVDEVAVGYIEIIPDAHEAGLRGDTEATDIINRMGALTEDTETLTAKVNALQPDYETAATECRASSGDKS